MCVNEMAVIINGKSITIKIMASICVKMCFGQSILVSYMQIFIFFFAFYTIFHIQCLYIFTLSHCSGVCSLHDSTSIRLSIIAFFSRTRFVALQLCIQVLGYSTICRFLTTVLRIKTISYPSRTSNKKCL